ncbi:hypothetical protein VTK26DRAFT_2383 [Humicola hyalothermophila]
MANQEFRLFSLVPLDKGADEIVRNQTNWGRFGEYLLESRWETPVLTVKSNFLSQNTAEGRFLSFGRSENCSDILVKDQRMSRDHCAIFLHTSGQFLIKDFSSRKSVRLYLWQYDNVVNRYKLAGDPPSRAIPMTSDRIVLQLDEYTSFDFTWEVDMSKLDHVHRQLAAIARHRAEQGLGKVPKMSPIGPETKYEAISAFTPVVDETQDATPIPIRQVHSYGMIGKGTFGVVYKALDLRTAELYAIKTFRPKCPEDTTWLWLFTREVEQQARLKHPNIIPILHHQGWAKMRCVEIFMPLCAGSALQLLNHHQCNKKPPVPFVAPQWLHRFIDQVLDALSYLHNQGLAHRDIKPENILYTGEPPNCTFMISDFGLAVPLKAVEQKRELAGTPGYIAPEVTQMGICTSSSDIYSFGITLLNIFNVYCNFEAAPTFNWPEKLEAYGVKTTDYMNYKDDKPLRGALRPNEQAGHSRVQSLLAHGLIPKEMERLLHQDPKKRVSALEARKLLLELYPDTTPTGGGEASTKARGGADPNVAPRRPPTQPKDAAKATERSGQAPSISRRQPTDPARRGRQEDRSPGPFVMAAVGGRNRGAPEGQRGAPGAAPANAAQPRDPRADREGKPARRPGSGVGEWNQGGLPIRSVQIVGEEGRKGQRRDGKERVEAPGAAPGATASPRSPRFEGETKPVPRREPTDSGGIQGDFLMYRGRVREEARQKRQQQLQKDMEEREKREKEEREKREEEKRAKGGPSSSAGNWEIRRAAAREKKRNAGPGGN